MITSTSPQRPADVVISVPSTGAGQVADAAQRARAAQREWEDCGPAARASTMTKLADAVADAADDLAALAVREVGKPVVESRGEVVRSVAILRYYAEQVFDPTGATHNAPGQGLLFTSRRPRGIAGLVTPWNFPFAIPLWKAGPALAYGNGVLLKPAEQATACALRLQELLAPMLPEGLLAVLPGGSDTGQAVVDAADVVSFTGSTGVGRSVIASASRRGVPVQAEMGGQNPAIVLPDAALPAAAASVASAIAGYAGQKCTATKRVIVVGDPANFIEALLVALEALPIGDPAVHDTVVGPVIDEEARNRLVAVAADAKGVAGRILSGGSKIDRDGWFVPPTIVDSLPLEHLLESEEVFGPICSISCVDTLDQAIERANRVRYGLVSAVYSGDLNAALTAAARLAAGMIKINAPTTGVDFYLPFGGLKQSGFGGREQGKSAIDTFTTSHTITIAPSV